MERIDGQALRSDWKGYRLGGEVLVLERTTSTNDVVRQMALQGSPEGLVVLAHEQTAGRGRGGRSWVSGPGESVLLSVLLRPDLPTSRSCLITALSALAAGAAIQEVSGLDWSLKWPNDIMIGERKAGGVLAETSLLGDRIEWAIVGVGLNVSTNFSAYPDLQPTATSLNAQARRPISRQALASALLRQMSQRYELLQAGGSQAVFAEWRSRLSTLGQEVRVGRQGETGFRVEAEGLAEELADDGALILRLRDGSQTRVLSADVSLR